MSFAVPSRAPKPDPADAPREATGAVASDSLAAESINNKGGFSENPGAALGVRGDQSTLNTTDTSAASELQPATSGAAREKQDALDAGAEEKGAAGLKLDAAGKAGLDGTHTSQGYSGGLSNSRSPHITSSGGDGLKSSSSVTTGDGPAAGTGVRPYVPGAPGYTSSVTGDAASSGTYKPKGANLEDADVTESMPKTKTFIGDVGGPHDPGRLAERDFNSSNANAAGQPNQSGKSDGEAVGEQGGQYGVLESERA